MKSCDRRGLVAVTAPEIEIFPVLNIGQKLLDGITDEQVNEYNTKSKYELALDHKPEHVNNRFEYHYDKRLIFKCWKDK